MIRLFSFQSEDYTKSLELRNTVLRIPLGLDIQNDPLHEEVNDVHIGYFEGDQIIGCLLLRDIGNQVFKMRQVVVSNAYQGKGIGQELVTFSERYAHEKKFIKIVLHARDIAVPFYTKQGYSTIGDPFFEVGITHYKMEKAMV